MTSLQTSDVSLCHCHLTSMVVYSTQQTFPKACRRHMDITHFVQKWPITQLKYLNSCSSSTSDHSEHQHFSQLVLDITCLGIVSYKPINASAVLYFQFVSVRYSSCFFKSSNLFSCISAKRFTKSKVRRDSPIDSEAISSLGRVFFLHHNKSC